MGINEHQEKIKNIKDTTRRIVISSNNIKTALSQYKLPQIPIEKRIEIAKKDFNLIYLSDDLKKIINEITEELASLVPLEDFIVKGIFWRAIIQWQITHSKPILSIVNNDRTERLRIGIEILNYVKMILGRSIVLPKYKKNILLNEVYRNAVELYDELLSVVDFFNNPLNQEYILDFEISNWFDGNYSLI